MLQKPLLTMFLALFHVLPVGDVLHISLVKFFFSAFGVAALTLFSLVLLELTQFTFKKFSNLDLAAMIAVMLFAISPVIRENFFNVRSDQIAFLLFSAFLLFCGRRQITPALLALLLIPCFGIKEIIFFFPGAIFFFLTFKSGFTGKRLFFAGLSTLMMLVWIIALNLDSAFYLLQTFAPANFSLRFGIQGVLADAGLLALAFSSIGYIFFNHIKKFYKICWISISCMILFVSLPQATGFFIASLFPFILLPCLCLLFSINSPVVWGTLPFVFLYSVLCLFHFNVPLYQSNFRQLKFIKMASKIVKANRFNYLDGEGVLPRENFLPCFTSPEDDLANNMCRYRIYEEKPDVLIITNRLFILGEEVFKVATKDYVQIYPNFWVIKSKMNGEISKKINLSADLPLPITIF